MLFKRPSVRRLTVAVFIVAVGVSVGGFALTRNTIQDQEQRLLGERGGEIATLLTSSTTSTSTALQLLAEAYAAHQTAGVAFTASAQSLVKGGVIGVGLVQQDDNDLVVRAVEGKGPVEGSTLTGARATLMRRALAAKDLVTALVRDPVTKAFTLTLAYGRADGFVVYQDSIADPTRPVASTPDSPFQELHLVLYAAPRARSDQLVLTTTTELPLSGTVDQRTLKVGADRWLLIVSPKQPLVGSLAQALPWIVLGVGIVIALIFAAIVELLARRRQYALNLVEERTTALRQSLDDLETARAVADAANRTKSAFLSRMSHELRTPLNAVLGFGQLLDLDELNETQQESVDQILKGGMHLLELINEVLDISRIETGELSLSPEAVHVGDLLNDTLGLIRPLANSRPVHVAGDRTTTCDKYVFADRQRLKQVLLNLLSNAVKYNRVGGTVAVSCQQISTTRLRIKVADTGPGIIPEHLGLLFVPFERLGAERSDVEGIGIGLALSQQLAQVMGGTLDLETTVGEGSTFWVELPLVEGPVERYERLNVADPVVPADEAPPEISERHTVLYIEDNLANLKLVQRVIDHRNDVEVIPAMQGRLGLELARDHHPKLILLDLHLPDMRGDQVLQELREDPSTAGIPVVILSADATLNQVQRLLNAGASAYLTKPFQVRELMSTLDDLLVSPPAPSGDGD